MGDVSERLQVLEAVAKRAEDQGWWVERRADYFLFFPANGALPPIRAAARSFSSRAESNLHATLRRSGFAE